jgi:hypothetical protein
VTGAAGGNHGGVAGGIGSLDESNMANSAELIRGNGHGPVGGKLDGCACSPNGAAVWSQYGTNSSRWLVILRIPLRA